MLQDCPDMIGRRRLGLLTVGAVLALPAAALSGPEPGQLLQRANITLNEARSDPQFGAAPDFFRRARAIMVVPQLVKGGFFLGGEGGNAVLLRPTSGGQWGNPLFYAMGSASFGLQIGVEVAEVALFVMSDRALRAWTRDEVKLGVQAGLTVLVIGSNAAAAATTNANVDVIAWARSKGAYAGITIEGSVIKARNEWNTAYYGHPVSVARVIGTGKI